MLKKLLKETIDLWCKMRWLKLINKECDKYKKLKSKLSKQQFIVNALTEAYLKVYGENLRKQKVGEGNAKEKE
jgi:hypothetical protein